MTLWGFFGFFAGDPLPSVAPPQLDASAGERAEFFVFFPLHCAAGILSDLRGCVLLTFFPFFQRRRPDLLGAKECQRIERMPRAQIPSDPLRQRGMQRIERIWCIT
jgi:hypothetical protein